MKVIIAGGREFKNYGRLKNMCDYFLGNLNEVEVVCGMARGADKLGKQYAEEKNFKVAKFPADWEKSGKGAGAIRNEEMAIYADALILFWDGMSRGSADMLKRAKAHKLKIREVINEY